MAYVDLKIQIDQAPKSPGVYRMLSADSKILYVGKAKSLRNRLTSYLRSGLDKKTQLLLGQVASLEFTVCGSEWEALILESDLIKQHQPHYNILLKDDKSYPYLYVSIGHAAPRIDFVRATKKISGRYFGPYPSAGSVRENVGLLQKIFKLRICQDSVFNNRTRPCLQYQIGRCSAPCVGKISTDAYNEQVKKALLFLEGRNEEVIQSIQESMQVFAAQKHYEKAAIARDQIAQLRALQRTPDAMGKARSFDALAIVVAGVRALVSMVVVRDGRLVGHRLYKPVLRGQASDEATILSAFMAQYYLNDIRASDMPARILFDCMISGSECLAEALSSRWKKKIVLKNSRLGQEQEWTDLAYKNAQVGMTQWMATQDILEQQLAALQSMTGTDELPQHIECFDVSHTSGEAAVASCVVFRAGQMDRRAYRRFNLSAEITPGDDYAALKEALLRRYKRILDEVGTLPGIVLIDGGKGQLRQAGEAMQELGITGLVLLSIAKGPKRLEGQECYFKWEEGGAVQLGVSYSNPARELLQSVRDEAHRFAITGHRARRSASRIRSTLEDIPGVGKKRRGDLLQHFGGIIELKKATLAEIGAVPGVGSVLASVIFKALHSE